jgi:ubiquinone/menaquinone biosynthesis C-methylase UbiE
MDSAREVVSYYQQFAEETRLGSGAGRLEFERTKEILKRLLQPPPARIVDVGGAAGVYSVWLAEQGYEVHLVDLSERLVDEARRLNTTLQTPIATLSVGDARQLPQPDAFADAVLVMGPLYHLTEAADRQQALAEARRVLKPAGSVAVAGISRYASALHGLASGASRDPAFRRIRDRDLRDGQHRNDSGNIDYFTTAYFHRPEDLGAELRAAGFDAVQVLGVEGAGWMVPDFNDRWADPARREDLMATARAFESEPSIVGVSAHLLALGRRPAS